MAAFRELKENMGSTRSSESPTKRREPPPTLSEIESALGPERAGQIERLRDKFGKMGLIGELHWYSLSSGWAFRFRVGQSVVCSLHLSGESNVGVVDIGSRLEPAIMADLELGFLAQRLLVSTPRRGPGRHLEIKISSDDAEESFVNLVSCKKRALKHLTDDPWPEV
jgi:hypothetical protein